MTNDEAAQSDLLVIRHPSSVISTLAIKSPMTALESLYSTWGEGGASRAKGPVTSQPRATPWVVGKKTKP